ncbi:MAG: hypothetical protein V9E96_12270 [Chitinophagaceae bacterium]
MNIQTFWGEYLPAWHPWEDYRTSYAAQKENGGGAALTLSHDIDVVNWIANSAVQRYSSFANHHSALRSKYQFSIRFKHCLQQQYYSTCACKFLPANCTALV